MNESLRVLLIEDSEDDALLVARELERGGLRARTHRVDTGEAMSAALNAETWDAIISDHALPKFGGREALEVYHQAGLDIPFIIVSGAIGEETAVAMMRAGAHDYVMKENLARLAEAVKREVRAAGERRARKETERINALLAAIVESCEEAVIGKTLEGKITSWNRGAERLYGYTASEMIGRSVSTLVPPARLGDWWEISELLREGQVIERYETVRRRKDGREVEISLTISPIRDAAGKLVGASSIARDISSAKQDERDRLQLIQELSEALGKVKTLSGLLPICASCKKIRDDSGYWQALETFLKEHSYAEFTHSICPECTRSLYPDYADKFQPSA